jgi:alpha-tubulin suppressor-like RCC1 family protein
MTRLTRRDLRAAAVAAAMVLLLLPAAPSAAVAPGVKYLNAGTGTGCAIRTDTTLWCWGDDEVGSVGDGGPTGAGQIRPSPVRVRTSHGGFLTGMTSVVVGAATCARRNDGTAWCWGDDRRGQAGDGTFGDAGHIRRYPVEVMNGTSPLTGVVTMAGGDWHMCALRTSHTVWCWGAADHGELGDGTFGDDRGNRMKPVEVRTASGPLTGVKAIAAAYDETCALRTNGTMWCWGFDTFGQVGDGTTGDPTTGSRPFAVEVVGPTGGHLGSVTAIATGYLFSCALRVDGSLWCWGDNQYGQIGDGAHGGGGSLHVRLRPVRVLTAAGPLTDVRQIDAGQDQACARRGDRSLWCWGNNQFGQLGTGGGEAHKAVPVSTGSGPFTGVAKASIGSDAISSCALKVDQTAWCWGYADQGQIGNGTTGTGGGIQPTPAMVVFP